MPQKRLPKQALLAKVNEKRPLRRPRTIWTNYMESNPLGLYPSKMMDVMEDREVLRLNLELPGPQPLRKNML